MSVCLWSFRFSNYPFTKWNIVQFLISTYWIRCVENGFLIANNEVPIFVWEIRKRKVKWQNDLTTPKFWFWSFSQLDLIFLRSLKVTWLVMIQCLSLVEITVFRLESKSCKGFFFDIFLPMRDLEFLTDHVTFKLCYNRI